MNAAAPYADPWRFVSNVEVYLLVAFLIGSFVYMVRVIGPKAVAPGEEVMTLLERLNQSQGITLVVVTHDSRLGARARRQIRMNDGQIVLDSTAATGPQP